MSAFTATCQLVLDRRGVKERASAIEPNTAATANSVACLWRNRWGLGARPKPMPGRNLPGASSRGRDMMSGPRRCSVNARPNLQTQKLNGRRFKSCPGCSRVRPSADVPHSYIQVFANGMAATKCEKRK